MKTLTLLEPPSSGHYWRVYRSRIVRTDEARRYTTLVAAQARLQGARVNTTHYVAVIVHWYRKIKRGDLDNRLKVLLDALQGVCYVNDEQISELHAYRHDARAKSEARVTVQIAVRRELPAKIRKRYADPHSARRPGRHHGKRTPSSLQS